MKICLFYHSLLSDWNHGNAHFLRGIATELQSRRHEVVVYEPADAWSLRNLRADYGDEPLRRFHEVYPTLESVRYDLATLDLGHALAGADLVVVHEWNTPELVQRIGAVRAHRDFVLLFHDTHHRLVTEPGSLRGLDLSQYDGVLAYGNVLRDRYLAEGLTAHAWTWHEAADTRVFRPRASLPLLGDVVWIGNWGDGERTEELHEFLIEPVRALGLRARVYGVRYPDFAIDALASAGIEYGGWLPNFDVPSVFSEYKVTVHVPRRPYVQALPGIPTIRPFEALACGIPLVCSPWSDFEELFSPGEDFLIARDGREMTELLRILLADETQRWALATNGVETIQARHTCAHRVDELLDIYAHIRTARCAATLAPAAGLLATRATAGQ